MAGGMFARETKGKHLDDETLSCYMDGALTPAEMASARRHLAACPDCAANLRSLQQTVLLLKELPQVACPRSFILREADVAPQRARPSGLFVFLRAATAAVAMLLAVVLAGDLLLRQTAPVPFGTPDLVAMREMEPAAGVQSKAPAAATSGAAAEPMAVAPEVAPTEPPAAPSPQPTAIAPVIATQVVELAPTPTAAAQRAAPTSQPPAPLPTLPTASPATRGATLSAPPPSPASESAGDKVAGTQVIQSTTAPAFQPTAEPDETATASAAMTAAPPGKGGEEPAPTAQPAAEAISSPTQTAPLTPAKPIPPTATPALPTSTPPRPTPTPPAATAMAQAEPRATVAPQDLRPVSAPAAANWGPLFRIAEITLGLIVLALAALTFLSRRT